MKKILIIATILVLVLVGAAIFYFKWRHEFIRSEVPKLVFLRSDSLYHISYGDVYIDEVNGEAIINDLVLRPDTTFKRDAEGELPHVLLEVSIPRLHLTGLQTEQAMLNEELIARKLQLSRPVVTLFKNGQKDTASKKDNPEKATQELYKVILRNLKRIKVDTLLIDTAQYNMVRWNSRDTTLSGSRVNVALYDINISDSTSTDTSRVLFAKRAFLTVDSLRINTEKKLYSFRSTGIDLNSEQRLLTAKTMFVVPLLNEEAFMKTVGKQTDRFDVDFTGASFSNINVNEVLNGNIVAENLIIKEGMIRIYRDKNFPRNTVNKVGKYPHQLLKNMPVAMSLNKLSINSGYIEYKERSNVTGSTGKIRFHNISLSMTNLTNRENDLANDPACNVVLRAQFLNVIPLTINLKLYPGSENGRFSADGKLGGADAKVLNQIIQPLGPAFIESGIINDCEFHLKGNDYGSTGTVKLLYNDLKIKVLAKDPADGQFKAKKFASFLANAALKDDNPRKNKPPRIARINYKRDVYKSFFNLVWKSVFSGISETVGIEVPQAKMDNQ